jgi:arylsulfatase A-like enzyme
MATAVLIAIVVVLITAIGSMKSATAAERPNIVFVLTDDLASQDMQYLDGLRNIMAHNGTNFRGRTSPTRCAVPAEPRHCAGSTPTTTAS